MDSDQWTLKSAPLVIAHPFIVRQREEIFCKLSADSSADWIRLLSVAVSARGAGGSYSEFACWINDIARIMAFFEFPEDCSLYDHDVEIGGRSLNLSQERRELPIR